MIREPYQARKWQYVFLFLSRMTAKSVEMMLPVSSATFTLGNWDDMIAHAQQLANDSSDDIVVCRLNPIEDNVRVPLELIPVAILHPERQSL